MLSKTKFLYAFLLTGLGICLLLDFINPSKISYLFCAYLLCFVLLSIFLITRGFSYKIDTNVYFGILLLIAPIIQLLIYFNLISFIALSVFSCLTLSSLVVWLYFKDPHHKKLFFAFLIEIIIFSLPIYLTKISFWALIIISVVWFIIYLAVNHFKKG